ncbi:MULTISPECIES: BadF/BadG/BcrA/BcrD ATPase family protein [Roseateles]|uniref:Glucosamine kinase n=1 Tax=Pelomonas aquatica TaxID=431058 RepID=A0ABU1ZI65_9BURK|nr:MULTISPECIES: BadF/BadG/BcrA/BcrD ATPase family protein [Roseateles]MDR7299685.1 glucosamine kinase [Pelomonas aquatica]
MPLALHPSLLTSCNSGRPVRWWVGVDGGGTSTRAVVADPAGRILGRGESGASALGQGAEQAWRHVAEAIARAGVAGLALEDCALGLGLSGTGVPAQLRAFVAADPGVARFTLVTDGLAALLGAHGGKPGALLISGTGSVAEALLPDGRRRMVGGWGWQIGDEGSGAWLGQQAMKLAQAAYDQRAPAGPLVQAVWARAGATREAMLAFCAQAGQGGYASLAPLVFEHEAADPAAAALLNDAARALEALAAAVHPTLPLALAGSIALRLGSRLSPAVQSRRVEPQGDAAAGALWLIQQQETTSA